MLLIDSSRTGPSTKTLPLCADDYDSDVDNGALEMVIPADGYPRSAWCVDSVPNLQS